MADLPAMKVLQAGLQQLNNKWRGQGRITGVRLQSLPNGRPIYVFDGTGDDPGAPMPRAFVVPDAQGRPFRVPVVWRGPQPSVQSAQRLTTDPARPVRKETPKTEMFNPILKATRPLDPLNNEDIDKAYWWFFTPTKPRIMHEWHPAFHAIPEPTMAPVPTADHIDPILFFDARLPQYDQANFWAKPAEYFGCACMQYFQRPYTVLSQTVPETYLLVIDDLALDICDPESTTLGFGDTVLIEVFRDGAALLAFEDTILDPTNPDPAKRWAFTGAVRPIPLWMRFDRNQQLTIRITVKGAFPFQKTSQDTFCGSLGILTHGWLGSLLDNRDGTARPIDVGDMRDYFGDDILENSWIISDMRDRLALFDQWLQQSVGYVK